MEIINTLENKKAGDLMMSDENISVWIGGDDNYPKWYEIEKVYFRGKGLELTEDCVLFLGSMLVEAVR